MFVISGSCIHLKCREAGERVLRGENVGDICARWPKELYLQKYQGWIILKVIPPFCSAQLFCA